MSYHPSELVYGLLSYTAYYDDQEKIEKDQVLSLSNDKKLKQPQILPTVEGVLETKGAKLDSLLADWRVFDYYDCRETTGYLGIIYINRVDKQLVLSHRGTNFSSVYDRLNKKSGPQADYYSVFRNQDSEYLTNIKESTQKFIGIKKNEDYKNYAYSVTGHSLGGWSAEISAFYAELLNNNLRCVSFDAPGTKPMMEIIQKNFIGKSYEAVAKKLDITAYISVPNIVNCTNEHTNKTIYRFFPTFTKQDKEAFLEQNKLFIEALQIINPTSLDIDGLLSTLHHSMVSMLRYFDIESGKPEEGKYVKVDSLPIIEHKFTYKLGEDKALKALIHVIKDLFFYKAVSKEHFEALHKHLNAEEGYTLKSDLATTHGKYLEGQGNKYLIIKDENYINLSFDSFNKLHKAILSISSSKLEKYKDIDNFTSRYKISEHRIEIRPEYRNSTDFYDLRDLARQYLNTSWSIEVMENTVEAIHTFKQSVFPQNKLFFTILSMLPPDTLVSKDALYILFDSCGENNTKEGLGNLLSILNHFDSFVKSDLPNGVLLISSHHYSVIKQMTPNYIATYHEEIKDAIDHILTISDSCDGYELQNILLFLMDLQRNNQGSNITNYIQQKMKDFTMKKLEDIMLKDKGSAQEDKDATNITEKLLKFKEGLAGVDSEMDKVILLGNSGVGKSTLINYLLGNKSTIQKAPGGQLFTTEFENDTEEGPGIGNETESETRVPKSYLDKNKKICIYDLPGLNDNRGENTDFENSLYINALFTELQNAKILIVLPYDDIFSDAKFNVISELSRNLENFNLESYRDSIGVVITKCPEGEDLSLKDIKENLKIKAERVLKGQAEHGLKSTYILDLLIDAAFRENNIMLFHKPSTSLSNIDRELSDLSDLEDTKPEKFLSYHEEKRKKLKQERKDIKQKKMMGEYTDTYSFNDKDSEEIVKIIKSLKVTDKLPLMSELPLKEKTKVEIRESCEKIKDSIDHQIADLRESYKYMFVRHLVNANSIDERDEKAKQFFENIEESTNSNAASIFPILEKLLLEVNILGKISDSQIFSDFLASKKMYYLLKDLPHMDKFLSESKLQHRVEIYNSNEEPSIRPLGELLPIKYQKMNAAINPKGKYKTYDSKLPDGSTSYTIESPILQMKDVIKEIQDKDYKFIKIYSCTFYLDVDYTAHGQNLIIKSKIVKVTNKVSIDLSGKDAPATTQKDHNGSYPYYEVTSGADGQAAGSFYCNADYIINGDLLSINLNGGNGGDGSNASDNRELVKEGVYSVTNCFYSIEEQYVIKRVQPEWSEVYKVAESFRTIASSNTVFKESVEGKFGGNGGDAGMGGSAGIAYIGYKHYSLYTSDKKKEVPKIFEESGRSFRDVENGLPGQGGQVGKGFDFGIYRGEYWVERIYGSLRYKEKGKETTESEDAANKTQQVTAEAAKGFVGAASTSGKEMGKLLIGNGKEISKEATLKIIENGVACPAGHAIKDVAILYGNEAVAHGALKKGVVTLVDSAGKEYTKTVGKEVIMEGAKSTASTAVQTTVKEAAGTYVATATKTGAKVAGFAKSIATSLVIGAFASKVCSYWEKAPEITEEEKGKDGKPAVDPKKITLTELKEGAKDILDRESYPLPEMTDEELSALLSLQDETNRDSEIEIIGEAA